MFGITFYSTTDIQWDEFATFIESLPLSLRVEISLTPATHEATITRDISSLFLGFTKAGDAADFLLEDMSQMVGVPQKTYVSLEMTPDDAEGKTRRLGLEVVCAFAEKWSTLLNNHQVGKLHAIRTSEELFQRLHDGYGLA